jgi:hypothetical protein
MNWNEKDYQAVALFLDGQDVQLTDAQRKLARQVADDFKAVGPKLDVALPGGVLHRVSGLLVSPTKRTLRRGLYVGLVTTAAAAVVLLALAVRIHWAGVKADAITPAQFVEAYLSEDSEEQAQTETLSDEIAMRQDEWSASVDNFEQELGDLERPLDQTD